MQKTEKNLPHLSPRPELDSEKEMVQEKTNQGDLTIFRKPKTPDPFVNAKLTSIGCDSAGVERFWISCCNRICGVRSFLIDEQGNYKMYEWPPSLGGGVYAVVRADADTLWLTGGYTPFIKLTLSTGKWETYPREGGGFVVSTMVLDQNSGKLFCAARTAMTSFDTRRETTVRVYEENEIPPEVFDWDKWQNADGSYGFIMSRPGLSYLRWDPKTESVNWKRLTDDPQHPAISVISQVKYVEDGRAYIPHIGWVDCVTGDILPHEHPPEEEACWFGYRNGFVYGIQPDWLNASGRFVCWDPSNGSVRFLFTAQEVSAQSCALSQSGKIIMVDMYGTIRIYDAESGLLKVTRCIGSEREHICNSIMPIDENRIIGFPFISSNSWIFNTKRGRGVYTGRASAYGGQVDGAIKANGKVYIAAYIAQQLLELDPKKPICYPHNPHLVAHVNPTGGHGAGMTTDGTIVWAAFTPKYGFLDGQMIRYDTQTGEAHYKLGAVSGQQIRYPMYDPTSGQLIGGTSFISDCETATPIHDRAFAVILDPVTMEVRQKVSAPAAVTTLDNRGPLLNGQWLMQSELDLYVFDTKTLKLDRYEKRGSLPDATVGQIQYTGEIGMFVIQIGNEWHLWDAEEDTLKGIASQEPDFVDRWWIDGADICFDCRRFAAVWRNWNG